MSVEKTARYAQPFVLYKEYQEETFGHLWVGCQNDMVPESL